MFNGDFYPSPVEVIEQMTFGLDLYGKNILEPSAGKGNIIDYCKEQGAKVYACEINPDLAIIAAKKANKFIKNDFLDVTSGEISHIDIILMNPPFSADEKHVIHAYNIAPEGCTIVSIVNSNTLRNNYTTSREVLSRLIKDYGKSQNIGSAFSDSERKTDVEVSIVTIYKPRTTKDTEFDGFFDMNNEGESDGIESGLMTFNEIRDTVNRYIGAVKMFDSVIQSASEINKLISPINSFANISFGAFMEDRDRRHELREISRTTFKKELQKSAWREVFGKLKLEKYLTQKVKEDLNKFIESQENVPFTMGNIYRMMQLIIGTHQSRMNQILCLAFDTICEFSNENNTYGEGWKTNANFLVKQRFIHPHICEYDTRWPSENLKVHYRYADKMDDIIKALCLITGENYEDHIDLRNYFDYPYHLQRKDGTLLGSNKYCYQTRERAQFAANQMLKEGIEVSVYQVGKEWGKWHDWGFFRVRGYKKGTMHFEFKDENVWALFNQKVAEIRGWKVIAKAKKQAKKDRPCDDYIHNKRH